MDNQLKAKRQDEIIRLVTEQELETQEQVAGQLRAKGYRVTQATVSRDIRELKLMKVASASGGYRYAPRVRNDLAVNERLARILSDSLIRAETASNLVVVHTLSGSANVSAEALDTLGWKEIAGTIAGDNTIFVACRSGQDADTVAERIRKFTDNR